MRRRNTNGYDEVCLKYIYVLLQNSVQIIKHIAKICFFLRDSATSSENKVPTISLFPPIYLSISICLAFTLLCGSSLTGCSWITVFFYIGSRLSDLHNPITGQHDTSRLTKRYRVAQSDLVVRLPSIWLSATTVKDLRMTLLYHFRWAVYILTFVKYPFDFNRVSSRLTNMFDDFQVNFC